jgi:hypothetical protein
MSPFWRAPLFALAGLSLLLGACSDDDDDGDDDSSPVLFGVTPDNELVRFRVNSPDDVSTTAITGLEIGEAIRAIDFRPADGVLYGLGTDNQIYTINTSTGAATALDSTITPAIVGATFGFDFNPVVDRIRVVADGDENYRLDPATGAVAFVDTDLGWTGGDVNAASGIGLVGAAYTNNVAGAATTVLYGIEQTSNSLVSISPPNNGQLNTIGALGVDVTGDAGFDISADSVAYAAIVPSGSTVPALYTIDLTTGAATKVGDIASERLTGLAVRP